MLETTVYDLNSEQISQNDTHSYKEVSKKKKKKGEETEPGVLWKEWK